MKVYDTKSKKSGKLRFWLVMTLCILMITVACLFAYASAKHEQEIRITALRQQELAAAVPETAVTRLPLVTRPPEETTAPETTAEPTEPEPTTEFVRVMTIPPEMQVAAIVTQAPQTVTETVTETETEPETVPMKPSYPMAGEILQGFSGGELVKSPTTGVWQTHNGIDIAGTLGDEVRAMDAGVVRSVEDDPLWGVTVTIDHDNSLYSRYCGLNAGVTVSEGDIIVPGMVIGALGDTADIESSMQTHLHFELLQGETYLDPVQYLSNSPE